MHSSPPTSPPTTSLNHPAIDAVLSAAASLLGMEVVFIGGLKDTTFTFERVQAAGTDWPEVAQGEFTPRADSICQHMLDGGPSPTADAAADPDYRDLPGVTEKGIRSYVGVPVRDPDGHVVATLCGIDRGSVPVEEQALEVLRQLAVVVSAHLGPLADQGLVIRRAAAGGWQVYSDGAGNGQATPTGDLTSAMVLADLLAAEVSPQPRPRRSEDPLDEVGQLRLSVTQLEHALAARVIVEQAIGVLTERQDHTPREAFERLRKVARARGRKVHDLAREVVLSASDPSVPLPPELAGHR